MATILFAWELGAGYGHLNGFTPLARKLQENGHRVYCVLKDLSLAYKLLTDNEIEYFQAPLWNESTNTSSSTYAEILLELGYRDTDQLTTRIQAWRQLYQLLQPDLLIADHAPTALLASRSFDFATCLYGSGFFSPPREHPVPAFASWADISTQQVGQIEKQAVECINHSLHTLAIPPIQHLADIFDVGEDFLATVEELDHYPQRLNSHYWGLRYNLDAGDTVSWPDIYTAKIFVYLHSNFIETEKLLQSLLVTEADVILHVHNMSDTLIRKYSAKHIRFCKQPVNVNNISATCDLAICHAGLGTVSGMLLHGVPLLLLPTQAEQLITAMRVQELEAGEYITPSDPSRNYRKSIKRLLNSPSYKQQAGLFAEKYRDFDESQQKTDIADRCEALIK